MNETFTVSDAQAIADLDVFVARAKRVDPDAIRLIAVGGVLAVYAPVLYPRGLLDSSPTILGLRTFAETSGAEFDRTVVPASISERVAKLGPLDAPTVRLPPSDVTAAWTGIAPPRGGWLPEGSVEAEALQVGARAGVAEIAEALPENPGDPVVQRIRSGVWSRGLEQIDAVPSGAAFAADSLGFLAGPESVALFTSGTWLRLTSRRGHVLVKRR